VLVAGVVLLAPLWLWADPLDGYSPRAEGVGGLAGRLTGLADPFGRVRLQLDDFDYVAKSRTSGDLKRHVFTPHSTHFVPLFRVWTFFWVQAAGRLGRMPEVLGAAAFLGYAAAMLLIGHLVAWESGRPALGLGVMAAFGVSAVLEPTVHWYSAAQAVAAGSAALAALAACQRLRARGGWWWLAAVAAAATAAPMLWSAGYVAGPAGAAYLWADGRPRARKAAVVPLAATALAALVAVALAGRSITASGNFHDRSLAEAANPVQGAISTAQAIVEILVLRNFGLDAATDPLQAVVLVSLLAAAWGWSRGSWRPSPLETAGLVLVVLGFGLVYTARGYFTFNNLRDLTWYQAIPQTGAALFLGGWCLSRLEPGRGGDLPRALPPPTRGGLLAVLGVVLVALVLQTPRVRARLVASAPAMSASESSRFPTPLLQRLRARYLDAEWVAWQRRFLERLDRVEAAARRSGATRAEVRKALGRVIAPGMPSQLPWLDSISLLALPESGDHGSEPGRALTLAPIEVEPEPRPAWLPPGDPWPPKR
jgi:hypothetical protein